MLLDISIAALAGGLLCLDRVLLEILVSRPIVAGTAIGFLLSDPYTGLVAGALTELLWIDRAPIGTVVPPNDTIASVLIAAAVIISAQSIGAVSRELIALGIVVLLPAALLGKMMDIWLIRLNERTSRESLKAAARGDFDSVSKLHISALVRTYLLNSSLIFALLAAGVFALVNIFPVIPGPVRSGLASIYVFLPVLGISVALNTIHLRGMLPLFAGVFLLMALIFESAW